MKFENNELELLETLVDDCWHCFDHLDDTKKLMRSLKAKLHMKLNLDKYKDILMQLNYGSHTLNNPYEYGFMWESTENKGRISFKLDFETGNKLISIESKELLYTSPIQYNDDLLNGNFKEFVASYCNVIDNCPDDSFLVDYLDRDKNWS